jgi:predicted anti-sigma-YlaC factor YlaD
MATLEISCLDVWREISNYIDEIVSPELRTRIEEHLKVCEHCTAIYDGTRNVVKLVADGSTYELPAGFSDRLRQRLENRFRSKA